MTDNPIQLIETLRVEPGRQAPLLQGHLVRLRRSCQALGYTWPDALPDAIAARLLELDPDRMHRLRVLVARDGSHVLQSDPLAATPTPVRLRLSDAPLAPGADAAWLGYKSTHRPWYAEAGAWLLQHPDTFDIIFCNPHDEVCEGSRTNVYVRAQDGNWLTPPLRCGLLPGVQRQALLDQGKAHEAVITRAQLQQATEVRISNALRGWLDAVLDPLPLPPA